MYPQEAAQSFALVCHPLLDHYGITYCCYVEHDIENERVFVLSTNADWVDFLFSNIQNIRLLTPRFVLKEGEYKEIIWPHTLSHEMLNQIRSFGMESGYSVFHRSSKKLSESWHFGCNKSNSKIIDLYLNAPETFRNIISYLKEKSGPLKKKYHKQCTYYNFKSPVYDTEGHQSSHSHQELLSKLKLNYYLLNTSQGEIKLTKREAECIYYLLKGKTYKEIAKILHLSPRTIESYLNNIRHKVSVASKEDLIKLFENTLIPKP